MRLEEGEEGWCLWVELARKMEVEGKRKNMELLEPLGGCLEDAAGAGLGGWRTGCHLSRVPFLVGEIAKVAGMRDGKTGREMVHLHV